MYAWNALSASLPSIGTFLREIQAEGIVLWALAGVFALAGHAKLRRPQLAALALVDFGLARAVRSRNGSTLGWSEIALAFFLVAAPWPALALAAASVVLWTFAFALARRLASGRTAPCFCFGDAAEPISIRTVARSAGLALAATLAALFAPDARVLQADVLLLQALAAAALLGTAVLLRAGMGLKTPRSRAAAEMVR